MHSFDKLIEAKIADSSHGLSKEEAKAEVIADACEQVLENSKAFTELAEANPTLWEKIKSWFKNTIAQIKAMYKGVDPRSYEAKVMKDFLDELTGVWDTAFKAAVENANTTAVTGGAGVQMQERTYEGLPADAYYKDGSIYDYSFLTAQKNMKIVNDMPALGELQTFEKSTKKK